MGAYARMDGTGELFGPLIQSMPESVTAEVLSYPQDPSADYETLTEFVLAHLPKDEPFVLVAESFSGPLAVLVGPKTQGLHAIILCHLHSKSSADDSGLDDLNGQTRLVQMDSFHLDESCVARL